MRFLLCDPSSIREEKHGTVAVIGAGPAGLAASGELVCRGYSVIVYDMNPEPGGLLIFGIPDLRLKKNRVADGIRQLSEAGVEFKCNQFIDSDKVREFLREHNAVLVATGTWRTRIPGIPGVDSRGVFGGLEWLVDYHRRKRGYPPLFAGVFEEPVEPVVVVGGGMTAADVALVARVELGLETVLVYRRRMKDSPMGEREAEKLAEHGVEIRELLAPRRVLVKEGAVVGLEVSPVIPGPPDETGRPSVIVDESRTVLIRAGTIVFATGLKPTPPPTLESLGILGEDGRVIVDDKMMTRIPGLFAAGDVVSGASLVGKAFMSGRKAGESISLFLSRGKTC